MFRNEFSINSPDDALKDTLPLDKVDIKTVDVFFCAGGHGPMFDFPDSDVVNKDVAAVYEKGGIVAAVCHGPAGKIWIGIISSLILFNKR